MSSIEALKASDTAVAQRNITIDSQRDERCAIVHFSQNGNPFETHDFFNAFTSDSAEKEISVARLGLPIAYQIVQRHKGTMTTSLDGSSRATLTIKLPLHRAND
jgi:signal transduction histidine kinase